MWVYSEKQKTWVNLEQVQRIASDGQGGYLLVSQDASIAGERLKCVSEYKLNLIFKINILNNLQDSGVFLIFAV